MKNTYLPSELVVVPKAWLAALTGIVSIESMPLERFMEQAFEKGAISALLRTRDIGDFNGRKSEYFQTPIQWKPE